MPEPKTRGERLVEAKQRAAESESARLKALMGTDGGVGGMRCPDPFAPDALKQLFAASFRAVWLLVHDPRATNRDRLEAFSAVGRVSGMGKEAPQAEKFSLPMASLLPATEPKPGEPT